jgi:hypothetical protein
MSALKKNQVLKASQDLASLANQLAKCPQVNKYDVANDREAWALTHSFADLESSFRTFLNDQLPQLAKGELTPDDTYDLLLDIGEEFRHILYHIIEQQKFYKYLISEGAEVVGEPHRD